MLLHMNPLNFMKRTVNLYNIMLFYMHHLSYHKPLKHILIGLMVDNGMFLYKVKKKHKTNKNKTNFCGFHHYNHTVVSTKK
jgi:hypothetical protein